MRKIWTKSAVVTGTAAALVLGGAAAASADTGDHSERTDQTETHVDDSGNVSLDDILNGVVDLGDVASGNAVLNGVDLDVNEVLSGILSGNDSDVSVDPDTDADVTADTDASSSGSDEDGGLLSGLLR
ncbi:hypothetical protein [Isoptericola sp. NPDC057653]|uniref:hypothetical protein n=1 Tax=unclassified Isoptericola TaxID=2623355 RepID=UPI0036984F7D